MARLRVLLWRFKWNGCDCNQFQRNDSDTRNNSCFCLLTNWKLILFFFESTHFLCKISLVFLHANVSHAVICGLYGQLTDWLSNAFLMMFMYLRCVDDLLFNHIHTGRRAMFDRPLSSFLLLLLLKWSHSNDIHRNKEHKKHWKPKWFLLYTK